MPTPIEHEESELLQAFEQGELKSIASESELAKFKAAAKVATDQALADRRHFALNETQWDEFQQALDRSVQAKPRLQNLFPKQGLLD